MEKQLIEGDRLYLIAESLAKDFSLFPDVAQHQEPVPGLLSQAEIDRRNDALGSAQLLYDRLAAYYGKKQLFFDTSGIEPGDDFVELIEKEIAGADAVLILIGKRWVTA